MRVRDCGGEDFVVGILELPSRCVAGGFELNRPLPLQVLPVSDTSVRGTWRDSYPYSALCVFALHPLYLRLQALAGEHALARQAGR